MSQARMVIVVGGLLVFVGVIMFVVLGREESGPSAQARFQARLEAARTAGGAEQVAEGTVRATGGTTETPDGRGGVIAWAAWQQVRMAAGSDIYRGKGLELGSVPFTVDTSEGPLLVDGELRGLSDLVSRDRSPTGGVEVTLVEGDQVAVLGPITERDGVRGLFDHVIVAKGSYAQWHTALNKSFFASLPR